MKIVAYIAPLAVAKPGAKKLFEKMLSEFEVSRTRTDAVSQQLMFYLVNNGINPTDPSFANEFQYGCWGQIGNTDIAGSGAPLDQIDAAFKNWVNCRKCAGIDGEGACNIETTPYEIGFNPSLQRIDCAPNPEQCAQRICTCDEELAFNLGNSWNQLDESNGFDHSANCVVMPPGSQNGGGGNCPATDEPSKMQCCGDYPNRFPFNDKGLI